MGYIVVRCHVTDLEYTIGVEIDGRSFDSLPDMRFKSFCPHCNSCHDWGPRDARLAEHEPHLPQHLRESVTKP